DAFACAPPEQYRDLVLQLSAGHQESILSGPLNRISERGHAPGDDRDLLHRVDARNGQSDDGVTHLVKPDDLAFVRVQQAIAFLKPSDDSFDGLNKLILGYGLGTAPGCK